MLATYLHCLFSFHQERARHLGVDQGKCGSVTAIQRFSSSLNLNVHFHTLCPDGVFVLASGSELRFVELTAPSDTEIAELCTGEQIIRLLQKRGRWPTDDGFGAFTDQLQLDHPLLAETYGASITGRIATGPRAGQRVRRYRGAPQKPWADGTTHLVYTPFEFKRKTGGAGPQARRKYDSLSWNFRLQRPLARQGAGQNN